MSDSPELPLETKKAPQKPQTSHLLLELAVCVILPTLVLKYMSGDDRLGPVYALILGLSFPLLFGIHQFIKENKVCF